VLAPKSLRGQRFQVAPIVRLAISDTSRLNERMRRTVVLLICRVARIRDPSASQARQRSTFGSPFAYDGVFE
jgi:hypothetical protein